MKRIIVYIFFLISLSSAFLHAQKHRDASFEIKDGNFYYNGKITPIIGGELHYPRVPHQYWQHRLRMMKAMGLNAVTTYVFWNLHEPEPGKWDFEGDKNLAEFVRIAGNEDSTSWSLCLCRMGIWRLSLVVAKYSGDGNQA